MSTRTRLVPLKLKAALLVIAIAGGLVLTKGKLHDPDDVRVDFLGVWPKAEKAWVTVQIGSDGELRGAEYDGERRPFIATRWVKRGTYILLRVEAPGQDGCTLTVNGLLRDDQTEFGEVQCSTHA